MSGLAAKCFDSCYVTLLQKHALAQEIRLDSPDRGREREGSGNETVQNNALDFAMCHSHITEMAKICNPNVFSFLFE